MVGNVAYDISYMTVRGTIHRVKATRGSGGHSLPTALS